MNLKRKLIGGIAAVVLGGVALVSAAKPASAATYCQMACDQPVQYWCSGGWLWQVTGGDIWYGLGPAKGCIPW